MLNDGFYDSSIPACVRNYIGDPDVRVKNWIFLNSPKWIIIIWSVYASILVSLKRFMKFRQAFRLQKALVVYNALQVCFSAYIVKEMIITAYKLKYKLSCAEITHPYSVNSLRMANAFWLFYLTKIFDLADTVFFVLRKKYNQMTFLHVYHHATMIFNWYLGVLYLPGGQAFFSVLLNSFVHVIMYTYYMLSAMGPAIQKYLWWKKYITQLQLLQFVLCIVHILIGYKNKCKAPIWLTFFTLIYLMTLVALFINFYIRAYYKRKLIKSEGGPGQGGRGDDKEIQEKKTI